MKTSTIFLIEIYTSRMIIVFLGVFFLFTCETEEEIELQSLPLPETKKGPPPTANAGVDQEINYPENSVRLDGSNSFDSIGIISYNWKGIDESDVNLTIYNGDNSFALATGLDQGTHLFELSVMNRSKLIDKDTVQVVVHGPEFCEGIERTAISAELIKIGTLSEVRDGISIATAGGKLFFAGGWSNLKNNFSNEINVFDISGQSWELAKLRIARGGITSVVNGNKVFFAGGAISDGWDASFFDDIDIYDLESKSMSFARLSTDGAGMAGAAIGDKVLFAGGYNYASNIDRNRRVDIFNLTSGEWTQASLKNPKSGGHVAVSVGSKAYFAGGSESSDNIDVYDNTTDIWSSETMYESKTNLTGILLDSKIYWASGSTKNWTKSPVVEIYDTNSSESTVTCLSQATGWHKAVLHEGKIVFISSGILDIYNPENGAWYYSQLPANITEAISVNDTAYIITSENGQMLINKLKLD
ncbi:hypothetical protein NO995_00340 [Aestuariibaculum sp. M13]|uniref:Kelch repeat-containing protein n=1 Tax=Aestuariibaculum sp. M13 TaxID=2967132 RepID=UPI00215A0496|nr:kelch repeat-containing protein [Aestuariibaculum sp. M13]MCR8666117.1 hypothetical protein [Aestuariibaculum sp. M13]